MSEVQRILKPGGRVLLVTPNLGGVVSRIWGAQWEAVEPEDHPVLYRPQDLERLLGDLGLSVQLVGSQDLNPFQKKGQATGNTENTAQRQKKQSTRRKIIGKLVSSPLLSSVRDGVNSLLLRTRWGDKLVALAVKPSPVSE